MEEIYGRFLVVRKEIELPHYIKVVEQRWVGGFAGGKRQETKWKLCEYCSTGRAYLCPTYQYHVSLRPRVTLEIRGDVCVLKGSQEIHVRIADTFRECNSSHIQYYAVVDGLLCFMKRPNSVWSELKGEILKLLKSMKIEVDFCTA